VIAPDREQDQSSSLTNGTSVLTPFRATATAFLPRTRQSYKDISDDKVDIAVTKLKCPVALIRNRQLTSSSRSTVGFSSTLTMKRWPSRCLSATKILRSWQLQRQGQLLEQAEQFEHDYDNDNYSDYVEDVSVHALD
jgi:hypothetical protein